MLAGSSFPETAGWVWGGGDQNSAPFSMLAARAIAIHVSSHHRHVAVSRGLDLPERPASVDLIHMERERWMESRKKRREGERGRGA